MSLLSWIFGTAPKWSKSVSGNSTIVTGNHRVTVFPQDGGFKFCVARADRDDRAPYFSDVYKTADQAMASALAYMDGRPSPHVSMTEHWQAERTIRARQHLEETSVRLDGLARDVIDAKNVTALRKVEAKATSTIKSMNLAAGRSFHDGLDDADIAKAERLKSEAERLLASVQSKIAAMKAR